MIDTEQPGWLRAARAADGSGAVVAYGGAGVSGGDSTPTPVEQALVRGVARDDGAPPVVCLVPTASGDSGEIMDAFRTAFATAGAEPHVLSLFSRTDAPFGDILDRTDLVYVTGGAVANLAVLWRLHGLDEAVTELWRRGVPVSGSSAGACIWSSGAVTTSFGSPVAWREGLRLLPVSLCPHYDTQPERAQLYRDLVSRGELPQGYGVDERAAGVFVGGELVGTLADDDESGVHSMGSPRPRD